MQMMSGFAVSASRTKQLDDLAWDRRRGRRHALLSIGPRRARFPAGLGYALVERFSSAGDAVFDAFCDHPAAIAQAAWNGRESFAVATDELASVATKAVLAPPSLKEIVKRLRELQNDMFYGDVSTAPEDVRRLFDDAASSRLVHLRGHLDRDSSVDAVIAALVCGWLTEQARLGRRREARRSISEVDAGASADVFECLSRAASAMFRHAPPASATCQTWRVGYNDGPDRDALATLRPRGVALALGAPPAIAPARDDDDALWRWFLQTPAPRRRRLGGEPVDVPGYRAWLLEQAQALRATLRDGGILALLLRDVVLQGRPARTIPTADRVWRHFQESGAGFDLVDIVDLVPPSARRAQRDDTLEPSRPRPVDRLLVLKKRGA